jgi:hypothetical protein
MTARTALRLAAALATALFLPAAQAQLFRAYLSIDGSDVNPCTLAQPCRLLPAAVAAVAANGEIWMLDSANYNSGPVTVNKSVTILAIPGALGSVVALGGNAINITAAGFYVTLRNLNIVPFPGNEGSTGVALVGPSYLQLQGCNVTGFSSGFGVRSFGGAGRYVTIVDSVFRHNDIAVRFEEGASGSVAGSHFSDSGVAVHLLATTAQTSRVTVSRSVATRGQYGFIAESYTNASARTELSVIGSTVDLNGQWGVSAYSEIGAVSLVSVADSQLSHNNIAVIASGTGARVYARNNTVTQNASGFVNSAATFQTGGNNAVRDSTATNTSGTISALPEI